MSKDEKSGEKAAEESAQRRPEVDTDGLSENAARLARQAMPGGVDSDDEGDSRG